jgi:hypothetical protein
MRQIIVSGRRAALSRTARLHLNKIASAPSQPTPHGRQPLSNLERFQIEKLSKYTRLSCRYSKASLNTQCFL